MQFPGTSLMHHGVKQHLGSRLLNRRGVFLALPLNVVLVVFPLVLYPEEKIVDRAVSSKVPRRPAGVGPEACIQRQEERIGCDPTLVVNHETTLAIRNTTGSNRSVKTFLPM